MTVNTQYAFVFQPMDNATEDKKKAKVEKVKKCIRTAAGTSWEDPSLLEWESGKIAAGTKNWSPHETSLEPIMVQNDDTWFNSVQFSFVCVQTEAATLQWNALEVLCYTCWMNNQ